MSSRLNHIAIAVIAYMVIGELLFHGWIAELTGLGTPAKLWATGAVLTGLTVYVLSTGNFALRAGPRWLRLTMMSTALTASLGALGALSLFSVRERAASVDCLYCLPWSELLGEFLLVALAAAASAAALAPLVGVIARRLFSSGSPAVAYDYLGRK